MNRYSGALLVPLLLVACESDTREAVAGDDAAASQTAPAPGSPEAKVANATSAAPSMIAEGAAVMDWPSEEGGEMTELRPGSNGWTCMPDVPTTPGDDPMCLDQNFLAWAGAWQSHTTPEITGVGLSYMLRGGTDSSNTDPWATEPAPGEDWVRTGPHVMVVVPDPAMLDALPTDPDSGGPFVMWKGTPYAHIMIPVG